MEENKKTKTNLSTFLLILTILIIGLSLYISYSQKIETSKQASELQAQLNTLNETLNNLQNKINTNTSAINSNNNKITTDTTGAKSTANLKFDGYGYRYPYFSYIDNNGYNTDSWEYTSFEFNENGTVTYAQSQTAFTGTYKIVDNKIECDFKKFVSEHGKGEFDKDITLTLISDDKIIGSVIESRDVDNDGLPELHWGPQKVVYEFLF